jgi:hypothetical protein
MSAGAGELRSLCSIDPICALSNSPTNRSRSLRTRDGRTADPNCPRASLHDRHSAADVLRIVSTSGSPLLMQFSELIRVFRVFIVIPWKWGYQGASIYLSIDRLAMQSCQGAAQHRARMTRDTCPRSSLLWWTCSTSLPLAGASDEVDAGKQRLGRRASTSKLGASSS